VQRIDDRGALSRPSDRGSDESSLTSDELGRRHLASAGREDVLPVGEALRLRARLPNQSALPCARGERLERRTPIEGVASLGQAGWTREAIAKRLLVQLLSRCEAFLDALETDLEEPGELARAESQLGRSRPHLPAPGVGLHAIALAIARDEGGAFGRRLWAQADPARERLAEHRGAALGELLEPRPIDARQLGGALVHRPPLEAEPLAHERA